MDNWKVMEPSRINENIKYVKQIIQTKNGNKYA